MKTAIAEAKNKKGFRKGDVVIIRVNGGKGVVIRELELDVDDDPTDRRYLVRIEEHRLRQFLDCELDPIPSK